MSHSRTRPSKLRRATCVGVRPLDGSVAEATGDRSACAPVSSAKDPRPPPLRRRPQGVRARRRGMAPPLQPAARVGHADRHDPTVRRARPGRRRQRARPACSARGARTARHGRDRPTECLPRGDPTQGRRLRAARPQRNGRRTLGSGRPPARSSKSSWPSRISPPCRPRRGDTFNVRPRALLDELSSLNIGRYMLMMITPTMTPTPTIISGSMIEVRAAIDASTSSS